MHNEQVTKINILSTMCSDKLNNVTSFAMTILRC